MKDIANEFERKLEIFRKETEAGTQFLYSYLTIYAVIGDNKKSRDVVNKTPLFWRTIIGALQASFFMTLGRIFDRKSKYNIYNLLKFAQEHLEIFSKTSLAERKKRGNSNASEWLSEFLKHVYVPTHKDFERLGKYVEKYSKIYEQQNYLDIRNKIYAHKTKAGRVEVKNLFKKTRIGELEKIFVFLNKLHKALWELFHNGRKPVLPPMRYSVISIRKNRRPDWQSWGVHETIVNETQDFFRNFTQEVQQPHSQGRP
jgi:hypothetical protein